MTKMELSLGEGEPVSDLVSCEHWEVDSHGIRMAAAVAREALVLRSSSRRRSNSSCSDIVPCRGHQ